jgi:exopolysaccharide biosynthesis protein
VKLKLALAVLLAFPLTALAAAPVVQHPYRSVRYQYEQIDQPVPQKIYAAFIDLTDPNVKVRVSRGGKDPDGPGKWETTLMQPTKVADREGFDVVVNGDFFSHLNGKDAEGAAALKEFGGGTPAAVSGPAVTDGDYWGHADNRRAAFMIDGRGKPVIKRLKDPPSDASEVVAGSDLLVVDGRNVAPPPEKSSFAKGPHPRTAVGIRDGGETLVLVVIDGRKKGQAVGMSLKDTADVMLHFGCTSAMNLDGGGSSVLAIRNPKTGKMEIKNHPSDGRERSVANVLGVSVVSKPKAQTTKQGAKE